MRIPPFHSDPHSGVPPSYPGIPLGKNKSGRALCKSWNCAAVRSRRIFLSPKGGEAQPPGTKKKLVSAFCFCHGSADTTRTLDAWLKRKDPDATRGAEHLCLQRIDFRVKAPVINLMVIKLEASSDSAVSTELAFATSWERSSNPGRFSLGITFF